MKILYDIIHARAAKDFDQAISIANYKVWANHWIDSAKTIANEFEASNLHETAKAVRDIIAVQEKFV